MPGTDPALVARPPAPFVPAHALSKGGRSAGQCPNCASPIELTGPLASPDGTLGIVDGISAPGLHVDLRAEMDVLVLISNCPQINNPCNGFDPTPIRLTVLGPGAGPQPA